MALVGSDFLPFSLLLTARRSSHSTSCTHLLMISEVERRDRKGLGLLQCRQFKEYTRLEMGPSQAENPAQSLHAAVRVGTVTDTEDRLEIRLKGFAHFFTYFAFFSCPLRQAEASPN